MQRAILPAIVVLGLAIIGILLFQSTTEQTRNAERIATAFQSSSQSSTGTSLFKNIFQRSSASSSVVRLNPETTLALQNCNLPPEASFGLEINDVHEGMIFIGLNDLCEMVLTGEKKITGVFSWQSYTKGDEPYIFLKVDEIARMPVPIIGLMLDIPNKMELFADLPLGATGQMEATISQLTIVLFGSDKPHVATVKEIHSFEVSDETVNPTIYP